MLFLLSMTCRDGSACAPGTVSASARRKSLRTGLTPSGGIEGVRVNPRTGSVLLLYANDEAERAAFLLLAVAASEQPSGDVAVCGENLPEPAGRPSWGPFLRYIFVRPFMPVLVRVATAVAASVPFILKGVAALCRGRLSVDVLDAAAIGISLLRRDFKTARLLTLLLGFGERSKRGRARSRWTPSPRASRLTSIPSGCGAKAGRCMSPSAN